jgi:hypothetical protein
MLAYTLEIELDSSALYTALGMVCMVGGAAVVAVVASLPLSRIVRWRAVARGLISICAGIAFLMEAAGRDRGVWAALGTAVVIFVAARFVKSNSEGPHTT